MKKQASAIPTDREIVSFETAQAFDAWLEKHGTVCPGIYISIAKKGSGIRSVTYAEAVEVALCHGWIDGVKRSHDTTTFLQRFTPRSPRSVWSGNNKKKMQQLIKAKLVRPAGLATVKAAKANGQWDKAYPSSDRMQVPADLQAELKRNKAAAEFFGSLPKGQRYIYLLWLHNAKNADNRLKRLARLMDKLERGEGYPQ